MEFKEKVSSLVRNQFPDFYKEEGPNFLAFMEAYYEYLEENGKMNDEIRNLESYRDVSTTTDEFIQYFITTFLPSVPVEVAADKRLMIKYISEFNRSRGTLSAYKLFFRSLYNEDIEVNYPSEQILKVSDGDWRKERYLVAPFNQDTYSFIGKTIVGTESSAEALVEDIVRKNVRGRDIMQLLLSNIKGSFNHLEPIRLLSDVNSTGHTTIIESGINNVSIVSPGGQYEVGDVVDLISPFTGDFGKVVVTSVENLGGVLTFNLRDGGSGYTVSTDPDGTIIEFIGGDPIEEAGFIISTNDIGDTFAISINTNLISSNNIFGKFAPIVQYANGESGQMSTFANTLLCAADYGFPEPGVEVNNQKYIDNSNAVINIANTRQIPVESSLYGETSSANATVLGLVDVTDGDAWIRVDTYRQFQTGENVRINTPSGDIIGTVNQFQSNTIGHHVLSLGYIGNTAVSTLVEGDELVGRSSNAYGVITKVVSTTANGYNRGVGGSDDRDLITVHVTANSSANLTSQFDTGPMRSFIENEGLRLVGSNTTIGNVVFGTSNSQIENIYTKLRDAFNFEATTFGTIQSLSLPIGGEGYTIAPRIRVRENDIAALGIGEQYITLQTDDVNWNTGNSSFVKLDTNDRLVQSSTGASGDVKAGASPNEPISTVQYANGTYEMVVRVWQDFLQRKPGNIQFANNETVTLRIYDSSYVPGEPDTRTSVDTGTAKIVSIQDEGVLGENADIAATVGANGTITGLRVLDSGFCYRNQEVVLIETPNRNRDLATSAEVRLTLDDVANSEGYYATSKSHISTTRGVIQDSNFYQEFSYEVISPISLDRYRDYALELVHPAGQKIFGKYRSQSNVSLDVVSNTINTKRSLVEGTISINTGSFNVSGTSTNFAEVYSNNDLMIIEYERNKYYKIPINIVSDNTTANLTIAWANSSISGANAYYIVGSI